ncbi:type I-E CRISPR-associated protein Cas6/Cse3/CasE [Streptomyces sp. NPDC049954]|uniref:type I-E CRISPR-associated protein Cas6/Cse3/CasE n=1 Tax=Streptomyces sp. NPDC049954 TaxID=3155779 RepID=UPI0034200C58
MPYLSRIRINPLRTESRKLLASPHVLHGAVQGGLPGPPGAERLLWRLDADDPYRPHVYVLSRSRPDWAHLVEYAGWPGADGEHAAVRDYEPLLKRLVEGQEYAFRLTANPVRHTTDPERLTPAQAKKLAEAPEGELVRGFRVAHRTAQAQLDWFLGHAGRWGFTVAGSRTDPAAPGLAGPPRDERPAARGTQAAGPQEVRITDRRRHSFTKGSKGGKGRRVTFNSATFEGRLRVADVPLFSTTLLAGVGPAKAYGCGLLTVAPLRAE